MKKSWLLVCVLQLLIPFSMIAQSSFQLIGSDTVRTRLDLYKGNDEVRHAALTEIFSDAGCSSPNLRVQKVPGRKESNVICTLPGETDEVVLVGAHFDHISKGSGIVDNWSGASLLPSLFQSLRGKPHRNTYVFVGFSGEETGEAGSRFYVDQLSNLELSKIRLMITIDSIGLGPTEVWASRSDRPAAILLVATGLALKLPINVMNLDGVGESDEEAFLTRRVKVVVVHSITSSTLKVLHSHRDSPEAISFQDYYDTYHLLAGYLAVLDDELDSNVAQTTPANH